MPTRWDVVVVGGANTDVSARGPALPAPDRPVLGDSFALSPGGKGVNQAVAAARLGAAVALVARVGGDDRGDAILDRLVAERVDARHVGRDRGEDTGAALIQVGPGGRKQTLGVPGANALLHAGDVEEARDVLENTRVLLASLEVPLVAVERAIQIARRAGAIVVLDPAPARELPDWLLRMVDLIKPNEGEALALTGVHVRGRITARAAAHRLLARGVGAVAVQAADEGNLIRWPDGEAWTPLLPVTAIDTTGAGDAYAAALAVGLARGADLASVAAYANTAAGLEAERLGALRGLPTGSEVAAGIDRWM